ncbi:MAG TPA: aquaporin [Gemmatimonadales bacterium]|nr:aquaporin [Gemmatimonadales bacterium]
MNPKALRPLVAEFVGTALFVFVGVASIVVNAATNNSVGVVGISLAHGLGMAIIVTMTMSISGGHINPAVSVALWLAQKIDGRTLGQYVAAQLLGGVVGALLAKAFLPAVAARIASLGTPQLAGSMGLLEGIGLEAVLTFFLVCAVFGTAVSTQAPKVGGFGIGLAITVCGLAAGTLTGAAMNPARAFGPALVAWEWHGQAVYWLGPLIGATAAGALWKFILLPKDAADLG